MQEVFETPRKQENWFTVSIDINNGNSFQIIDADGRIMYKTKMTIYTNLSAITKIRFFKINKDELLNLISFAKREGCIDGETAERLKKETLSLPDVKCPAWHPW